MPKINITLRDINSVPVYEETITDPAELEDALKRVVDISGAYDNERYGGEGDVWEGSICWAVEQ